MVAPKKLVYYGIGTFVGGLFMWFAFPSIIKSQVKKATRLKKGGDRRPLWEKIPFSFDFKLHVFNITNPEGIEKGEKPIVQEVGPYYYEEWKEKVDVQDIDEDDTIEFNTKSVYNLCPEKGLSGEEELIIPHTLLLSIILTVVAEKPKLIGLVGKAIDSIFHKPSTLFMPIKPKDLFFDGLPIDCSDIKDLPGKGVCAILKEQADAGVLEETGEMKFKFSLFGGRNNTHSRQRWHARRGIKNIVDVGMMVEYDGKTELETWDGPYCNSINGTDGTIFAPFLDTDVPIKAFIADLCKVVEFKYAHPSKVKGIKTSRYTFDFGDIPNTPELQCFCRAPDKCLKKGALDLTNCMGAPLAVTLPHFYMADESYLDSVIGVKPEKDKHQFFLDFDLLTASPVEVRGRLQFNAPILPVEKVPLMAHFPEAMLPLFWIEQGVIVPKFVTRQLKLVHGLLKVVGFLKWVMVFGGIGMLGVGIYQLNQGKSGAKSEVRKVSPQLSSGGSMSEQKKWTLDAKGLQAASVPPHLDGNY